MRIGILQCDHVADDLVDTHGDYQDMFTDLVHAQDNSIEVCIYDLTADQFPVDLQACDGYIITGSQFSAYDDIPWINKAKTLVSDLYIAKIPTIGICFGHQLIADSLGGKVEKAVDKGWGVGVHQWQIKNEKEWMGHSKQQSISLRATHQDQVVDMPANSKLIASSEFCPIAGFQTGKHFLTLQGHPEFTREYSQILLEKRLDRIGKETSDKALESLSKDVDADTVGAWMINFFKKSRSV
jgi:GMP synthase-like glutamine amidotransferase